VQANAAREASGEPPLDAEALWGAGAAGELASGGPGERVEPGERAPGGAAADGLGPAERATTGRVDPFERIERVDAFERIEDRLARLAGAVGPLRRVLAAIAERLLASEAWARLGYARAGDYARERAGLSVRQLQELARVHRGLAELPGLERALVGNELPWSKVRLVARVATAQDEAAWIARARALPARRLEAEVRAHAPPRSELETPDAELPVRRVALRCTPAVAEKWALAREMAERSAGRRLLAGEALELVTAEVFSATSIDPAFLEEPGAARPGAARAEGPGALGASGERVEKGWMPAPRAPARELPAAVAALAVGLAEADGFELDRRLRRAVRLEQTLDAALAPLLRRIAAPEFEWRGDYRSLASYACDELGIPASKARALVRLERAGDVCRELREAYRSGRLSWVKAHGLLPLLLLDLPGEWRPAWVAWAQRVTVRRLAADVERALRLRAGHGPAWARCKFHPERAQDPLPEAERQLCAPEIDPEATWELVFRVPVPVAALFHGVRETLRWQLRAERGRLLHDGEAFDAMLDCALVAWQLRDPRARRPDPVLERDGYRCAVPGCTSRRSLHVHHVRFRSQGGADAPANLITLCAFHHQRCLHAGLLRLRGSAPGALVFELGLRPGREPLARYRSGDLLAEPGDGDAPEVVVGPPLDADPNAAGRRRPRPPGGERAAATRTGAWTAWTRTGTGTRTGTRTEAHANRTSATSSASAWGAG
jgi:hypothetical protein